jgi:phage shock protein C
MFCQKCGKPLAAGANYCANCGAPANPGAYPVTYGSNWYRPRANRMIAGVCAALNLRYGWDLIATRIVAVLLGILLFPVGEIAYLVAWLLIPEEPVLIPQAYSDPKPPVNA